MENPDIDSHGQLLEELTLHKDLVPPRLPDFTNFGGHPQWWSYWGRHNVPAHWNPKNLKTVEYRNEKGELHRTFGPAFYNPLYKIEAWYCNDELHRVNGPAYIHGSNMAWFQNGELHRLDGPAVITDAGPKQYWIKGVRFSKKQYMWEIHRRKRKGLIK